MVDKAESFDKKLVAFEVSCRYREDFSSVRMACETLSVLKACVDKSSSPEQIQSELARVCARLQSTIGCDTIVTNICDRILHFMNNELNKSDAQALGFYERLVPSSTERTSDSEPPDLRQEILSWIQDVEHEEIPANPAPEREVAKLYRDYIHDGDIIMTIGLSASVRTFLTRAAKKLKFAVLIPELAPTYDGITMARELRSAANAIECIVIPDSAVFALMPRVTTILAPCRALFADGTLLVASFVQSVALAARHYSKPFVVLYWRNKLANRFLKPHENFTVLGSPYDILPYDDFIAKTTTILNPDGEVMQSQWVTVFINEERAHGPADLFPLVREMYEPEEIKPIQKEKPKEKEKGHRPRDGKQ
jgi:translation initiation factor eIF-2B subunit beta